VILALEADGHVAGVAMPRFVGAVFAHHHQPPQNEGLGAGFGGSQSPFHEELVQTHLVNLVRHGHALGSLIPHPGGFVADIEVSKEHPHGKDGARERVEPFIQKMAGSLGLKVSWDGDECRFEGPAKGLITVCEDKVDIEVKLGLAAKMMKGSIKKKIEEGLDRALT
jgi:putative polyhydroxyalkanoate system protein